MNELKSYTEYAVSTPTADFVIGFDFNYGEDAVNVTVDDVSASEAGYTVVYLNETTIRLSPSVPSGVVRLQRETDIDQTDHAYRAGAKFIAQTMDENFEQLRHSQQEVRDGFVKLADDTYEIIDTLNEVGQSAQDAADAAEVAAGFANDAASQVSDKVPKSVTVPTYTTPEAGVNPVTGVADGEYYNVRSSSDESYVAEYQNVGGVAMPTGKSYPSSEVVEMVRDGVNTIADLLAIPSPKDGMRVNIKSYHADINKGGGVFVWDAASTTTPDNGIVFAVDGVATGRWIRQLESDGFVTPQMFGAKATGLPADDDYPAIMAAINYASSSQRTNTVRFQKGGYYSSETINLKKPVNLIGESTGQNIGLPSSSSVIYFAQGKDGIVVNGARSLGLDKPVQTSTTRANGSQIRGLALTQYGYNNLSRYVVDYNPTTQHFITGRKPILPVGSVIVAKDGRLREKARATVSSYTVTFSTMTVKALKPSLSIGDTITGATSGATGTVAYISPNYNAFSLSDITGSFLATEILSSPVGDMQALAKSVVEWASYGLTSVSGTIDIGDVFEVEGARGCGIVLLDRGVVDQCLVDGFPDNGLYITSTAIDGVAMNANGNKITSSAFIRNGRHGITTQGNDGNASEILGCDASLNTGYGVYDESFLGNYYFGCHTASNGVGAYYSRPYNNFSVFSGCYSEGSAPRTPFPNYASRFGRDTTVIGGVHGAGAGGSLEGVGTTSLRGGYLNVSNAMYSEQGVNSAGVLSNTFSFRSGGTSTETIELCVQGNRSAGRGAGVVFNMPLAAAPFRSNNTDLIKGGVASVSWVATSNSGANFSIDLTRNEALNSLMQLSVPPSDTASGNAAVVVPVISNGVITALDIKNAGKTYTSAPTITGTGSYAGFTATTEISNGSIVAYTITSPATSTNLQGYNLQRALNVTVPAIYSGLDNVATLGTASNRWSQVYAGAGTINTSDEREKQQIRDLTESEKRVAVKLKSQIKAFKFNDAVAEKGDNARIHFGVIAQEVKAAFESEGLVAEDYAILCYDEWEAEYREVTEEITVTNESGEEVTETVETGERELIREAGNRYGVRYEELLAFIISTL